MADLGGTFDANAKENNQSSVVPTGEYRMVLVKSERKPTKDDTGAYLNCEFKIASGEYQNRTVFHMFHLWNKSEKAVTIAKGQFSELCRAVGILTPKDSSELHNRPFLGKVNAKDDPGYGMRNEMKGYKPVQMSAPVQTEPAPQAAAAGSPW